MPTLTNQQHEAFAQARFSGKPLAEAHYAAGYAGDEASASRLSQFHEVRERIAELYREAATQTAYEKTDAVRDLLTIIHTAPSDTGEDHPLCEVRMGKDGPYHRLPPKLQAMARLIKLMGWSQPEKVAVELKDNLRDLLIEMRRPHNKPLVDPEPVEPSGARQIAAGDPKGSAGGPNQRPQPLASPPSSSIKPPVSSIEASTPCGYCRDDAVHDLILIIRARPTEASPDHPYCEARQTSWGVYHRFPSKLGALTLLSRMLGWHQPTQLQVHHDPDAGFKKLAAFIRTRS